MREIRFALGYMPHRLWGSILQAQVLEKEGDREFYSPGEYIQNDSSTSAYQRLSPMQRQVLHLMDEYSDRKLHRVFSKHKTVKQFLDLVVKHRSLDTKAVDSVTSARVYLSKEALEVGLVDEIGYLSDAIMKSKRLANLSEEAKVIVYRRTEYPDDNVYNTKTLSPEIQKISLVDLNLPQSFSDMQTGFYYLWMPSSD